jgi:phage recombination protein Bet
MTQAVVVSGPETLPATSNEWTREKLELLKRTICKDSTDDEFQIFIETAKRTGLNPFMKQIHAVKRWNSKANRNDMSIQVGIDGFRLIADRSGRYAGSDEPVFDNEKNPTRASVTVYKMVQGQRCPFTATARWSEYFPGDAQGFMWKKMPCVMLGKCAESLALRKAFPAELSGLYTNEEMAQADAKAPVVGTKLVVSEQPEEGDGFPDDSYKITFGQWKNYSIEQVVRDKGAKAVRDYIAYLEDPAQASKRKPDQVPKVAEFIERASDYIASLENGEPVVGREPGSDG